MVARLASVVLGIWLMAAPSVLGYGAPASANDRIVGPLVAAFATVAIWEVTRPLRWVDLLLGMWLLAAPFMLGYATTPLVNSLVVGLGVAALALVRGSTTKRFGGGWSALWRPPGGGPNDSQ